MSLFHPYARNAAVIVQLVKKIKKNIFQVGTLWVIFLEWCWHQHQTKNTIACFFKWTKHKEMKERERENRTLKINIFIFLTSTKKAKRTYYQPTHQGEHKKLIAWFGFVFFQKKQIKGYNKTLATIIVQTLQRQIKPDWSEYNFQIFGFKKKNKRATRKKKQATMLSLSLSPFCFFFSFAWLHPLFCWPIQKTRTHVFVIPFFFFCSLFFF